METAKYTLFLPDIEAIQGSLELYPEDTLCCMLHLQQENRPTCACASVSPPPSTSSGIVPGCGAVGGYIRWASEQI